MIIRNWKFKNFRSYGNIVQKIELNPDEGELILLTGRNAAGKSTLADALSFTLYGKVKGKKNKPVVLSTLPNRRNGDLWTSIEFGTPSFNHISIERTLNPSKATLLEDKSPYNKAGSIQNRIEEHTNFDFETFNSFISTNINDFKNFMELPLEDKRKLMDRLFNLEAVAALSKILKAMRSQIVKDLESYDTEAKTLQRNIETTKQSIDNATQKKNASIEDKIKQLKDDILSKKGEYENLSTLISGANKNILEYKDKIKHLSTQIKNIEVSLKEYENQITVYKSGKCPTCHTELSDDFHLSYLVSMEKKQEEATNVYNEYKSLIDKNEKVLKQLVEDERKASFQFQRLEQYLSGLKEQIKREKVNKADESITEFENMLKKFEEDIEKSKQSVAEYSHKQFIYDKAVEIFSDDGVKKMVISKVVKPMNKFVEDNIKMLKLPYKVILDEDFDAKVYEFGEEIDNSCLSTGETKKVNVCIMMAYIMLIRLKRHINLLFLDEVFASIDVESIEDIIEMLKKFAKDYNVNVFLVHHSQLPESYFDRIIKISKSVFSDMEDTKKPVEV